MARFAVSLNACCKYRPLCELKYALQAPINFTGWTGTSVVLATWFCTCLICVVKTTVCPRAQQPGHNRYVAGQCEEHSALLLSLVSEERVVAFNALITTDFGHLFHVNVWLFTCLLSELVRFCIFGLLSAKECNTNATSSSPPSYCLWIKQQVTYSTGKLCLLAQQGSSC